MTHIYDPPWGLIIFLSPSILVIAAQIYSTFFTKSGGLPYYVDLQRGKYANNVRKKIVLKTEASMKAHKKRIDSIIFDKP
jgi:hypothetical protein